MIPDPTGTTAARLGAGLGAAFGMFAVGGLLGGAIGSAIGGLSNRGGGKYRGEFTLETDPWQIRSVPLSNNYFNLSGSSSPALGFSTELIGGGLFSSARSSVLDTSVFSSSSTSNGSAWRPTTLTTSIADALLPAGIQLDQAGSLRLNYAKQVAKLSALKGTVPNETLIAMRETIKQTARNLGNQLAQAVVKAELAAREAAGFVQRFDNPAKTFDKYNRMGVRWQVLGRVAWGTTAVIEGVNLLTAENKVEEAVRIMGRVGGAVIGGTIGGALGAPAGPPGVIGSAMISGYAGSRIGEDIANAVIGLQYLPQILKHLRPPAGSMPSYLPKLKRDTGLYTEREMKEDRDIYMRVVDPQRWQKLHDRLDRMSAANPYQPYIIDWSMNGGRGAVVPAK